MIEILYNVSLPKSLTLRLNARFRKIKRLAPLFFHPKKSGHALPRHLIIAFVNAKYSQALNKTYRKKLYVPNVLSFLYDDSHGEVFITPSVVKKEAKKSGESLEIALVKMAVHGMIHCSGVNHEISNKADRVSRVLEQQFLSLIGA